MATNDPTPVIQNNYKVRLISVASVVNGAVSGNPDQVIFDVTPAFSETGSVEYASVNPIHMPGGIQVYKRTPSRSFTIGAKLLSRTMQEAAKNMQYLQTLRSWRMPYFGNSSTRDVNSRQGIATSNDRTQAQANQPDTKVGAEQANKTSTDRANVTNIELLGAPPNILYLYAYSTSANDSRQNVTYGVNINKVPVVMSDLSITYPEDVDYLPVSREVDKNLVWDALSEPFPIRLDVSITLLETHSPHEYETFSLTNYKTGKLVNF